MDVFPSIYKTKTVSVNICGAVIKITSVTNISELYDLLIAKGENHIDVQDERIPYWAELWHSSIALSQHLVEENIIQENSNVLEIGCGLGLPGIVAGMLGAKVTFTDYMEESIMFAKHNWSQNNSHDATFKLMDWRKPDKNLSSEIVLASDVVYESRSFDYLVGAYKKLIKPGGTILMSEPNRVYAQTFFTCLKQNGFKVRSIPYYISLNDLICKTYVHTIKFAS